MSKLTDNYYSEIVDSKNGIELHECIPFNGDVFKMGEKRFYVVRWDNFHSQVVCVVPNDYPPVGIYFANGKNIEAIFCVSSARTYRNARKWFNLLSADGRE